MSADTPHPRQRATRERLLAAALHAFAHRDYDAVSTREIVEAAAANISAISYHFGGKQQLYLATTRFLATSIRTGMQTQIESVRVRAAGADPATCRMLLAELIGGLTTNIMLGELGADAASFIFREQNDPTEAFDILYRDLLEPLQSAYAQLLSGIVGVPADTRRIKLMTHALMGQIVIFRNAQTTVLRRLQQTRFCEDDIDEIKTLLTRLTLAAVDAQTNTESIHD